MLGFEVAEFHCGFDEATVVPDAFSRAERVPASVVAGRLALVERFVVIVVDACVAVAGRVAVTRVCETGRSFVTVVLLADVVVREVTVVCEVVLDAVLVGGLLDT